MKIKIPPGIFKTRDRHGEPTIWWPVLRIGLPCLLLAAVFGFFYDMNQLHKGNVGPVHDVREYLANDRQNLVLGLEDEPYVDPQGRFSIVRPAGWTMTTGRRREDSDAFFEGRYGQQLAIQVYTVKHERAIDHYDFLMSHEQDKQIRSDKRMIWFMNRRVVERKCKLTDIKLICYDFVEGNMGHHIRFSATHDLYDDYLMIVTNIIMTYKPGPLAKAGE